MVSMKSILFLRNICLITIIKSACAMDTKLPLAITYDRLSRPLQEFRNTNCWSRNPLFKACALQQWDNAKKLIKTEEKSLLLEANCRGQIPFHFIVLWNVAQDQHKRQQKKELIQEYCARFGHEAYKLFECASLHHATGKMLWDDIAYNGCSIAIEAAIIALLLKSGDKSFMVRKAGWLIKETPLHTMVLKNNLEGAQMLLDAAGDDAITLINEPDDCGDSPFQIAFLECRIDMLQLLYPYVVQDWACWLKKQISKLAYF